MAKRLVLLVLCLGIALVGPPSAAPAADRALAAGFCDGVSEIPKAECQALVALYNSTSGPGWTDHTDWLDTNTPCTWHGVTCSAGQVTGLALDSNQLSGTIPPELANSANLQGLDLGHNQLTGSIPSELGNLANLQALDLGNNQLTGTIPSELGNLVKLGELYLRHNQLHGSIPPELGNLANLTYLNLHDNQLSGSIPPELGKLGKLQRLFLEDTQLSGALPCSLTALKPQYFSFSNTDLCEPGDTVFQAWLSAIPHLERTSVTCTGTYCWWTWLPLALKAG